MNSQFAVRVTAFGLACAIAGCSQGQFNPAVPAATVRHIATKLSAARAAVAIQVGSGFSAPEGVAVDADGDVYVADSGRGAIVKIAPPFTGRAHGRITIVGPSHRFNSPAGVAVDAAGYVYVADTGNNRVERIGLDGSLVRIGAGFANPKGVAVDATGNVYVADYGNGLTEKISPPFTGPTLGTIFTIASHGADASVALDAARDVYGTSAVAEHVGDFVNSNVFMVRPPQQCPPSDPICIVQTGLDFHGFAYPSGIALDPRCAASCDFYVADTGHHVVVEVSPTTGLRTPIGRTFRKPYGVAMDGRGNLYVSDVAANSVFMFLSRKRKFSVRMRPRVARDYCAAS